MSSNLIARTGRVQAWLDNPQSKLPVSCTVFVVEDSMEGPDGIEASWRFVSHALRNGAGVAVHLSKLRPAGETNPEGLVASGPVSFARIYSVLNETLRRGGLWKNGACVIHLDADHADLEAFIDAPRDELPWVKKCIDINKTLWNSLTPEVKSKIYKGIQAGDLWLNKIKHDDNGERIYGNVCLEVYLPHRGSCLLQHVNLGQCGVQDLVPAFEEGMQQLVDLHGKTGVEKTGEYLPPVLDRQVGLGMLGLANFLSMHGVSYENFGKALYCINCGDSANGSRASVMADELCKAIERAAEIARSAGMDRAFAIAPTATCSYKHTDLLGYTTAPEIAPPISRKVDRDSETFGVKSYDYGPVEIASVAGWSVYERTANEVCRTLAVTGLFHGYSFNTWSDEVTYDDAFITEWLNGPQTSLYYALPVKPDTQRKDDVSSLLEDGSNYAELFGFGGDTSEVAAEQFCSSCAE